MCKFSKELLVKISEQISEIPFAVCSVLAFLIMITGLYFDIGPLVLVLFLVLVFLVLLCIFGKLNRVLIVIISLFMVVGAVRVCFVKSENKNINKTFDGEYARVDGYISSIPTEQKSATAFFLDAKTIYTCGKSYTENIKIYVRVKTNTDINYGDRIKFDTILASSEYYNPYLSNYYLAKGAELVATETVLLNIEHGASNNPAVGIRNYIIGLGDKFFSGDACELFKALTAGDRTGFSKELKNNLAISGLSHIVCVSGLHVSIIGMCIYNLLKRKNRYLAAGASFGVVVFFVLVTGASPSTVRAAIMFASFLTAILVVRENNSFTALAFSAAVLMFVNPYVIFDYGFILSFLSVLGIEIFSLPIKRRLRFLPSFMADSISVTVSAQLMTLPVCINMFGYVSVYSVLANLLVSVFFLIAVYLCFIFIFMAPFPLVNKAVMIVCTLFLDLIAAVADLCAGLPYSIIYAERFDTVELICYYLLILLFVFRKKLSLCFVCIAVFLSGIAMTINKIIQFKF